MVIFTVLKNVI